MRHVLFTTAWYPNRKVEGDGVFIRKHARSVARNHRVAVLMVQSDPAICGHHVEMEVRHGGDGETWDEILVYVPKVRREWPVLTSLLRFYWYMAGTWRGYREVRRLWQGRRPDICHVNVLTRAGLLPWFLWKFHHIPYIITEHWSRYGRPGEFPNSRLQWRFARRVVREAAFVCPVSSNLQQNMLRWKLENPRYRLVGNVVDTDTFVARPLPEERVKRIVHVSWMRDDSKNISGMLRVMARLRERRQDFELLLIGEGNDRASLERLSSELGVTEYVSFLPARQGEALAKILSEGAFLLMFSNYENQSVSVLEAMACGRPVVATRVGDLEAMTWGRGILVEPGDETALLEAVDRMLERYADYRPELLHAYVSAHHSPEVVAAEFSELYRRAIEHDF